MAKSTSIYYCKNCGYQSANWIGKCPACSEWNTFEQEVIHREEKLIKGKALTTLIKSKPKAISEIALEEMPRITTNYQELDTVLGGGIVRGSLTLLGGEPGIGKSTLLLQIGLDLQKQKVLYISGEESESQLKMRAERISKHPNKNLYILTETQTQEIVKHIEELDPDIVIVDSIQTMQSSLIDSAAGSISQIKECAAEFQHLAKNTAMPVFLIGHITKDGVIAGPKILEHIVDTVLQFEGDQHYGYRIVRCVKNRFGSTSELGIFEMNAAGLREVTNPSEILLTNRDELFSGAAVAAVLEGNRPLMIETQALVSTAVYGTPQRSATGFDLRRLNMLLAVLEKRCRFRLGAKDVFLNIVGGFNIDDPAINLAIMAAILSSTADISIDSKICFAGEMGLSGEVRPVPRIEQRISEAEKLGFKQFFLSKYNVKGIDVSKYQIKIMPIGKIDEMLKLLF
ncbi:MAG: DNA repair protein RadA [Lentimicrobiaceae bacterium]|nr:DNA repair protein RadA [Lentimicrobiaceae bacterium]